MIAVKRLFPKSYDLSPVAPRHVNLVVDIQEQLHSGKNPDYERWAKNNNLKQMTAPP